jgi:hypothetical protein
MRESEGTLFDADAQAIRFDDISGSPMSPFGTTSPFKSGRMNASFPPICVTGLSGQHVRFGDIGPLG